MLLNDDGDAVDADDMTKTTMTMNMKKTDSS